MASDQPSCTLTTLDDVLPLLLQHSCIYEHTHLVCALLCVCKSFRTCIAQQCRARLRVMFNFEGSAPGAALPEGFSLVHSFGKWLTRWAGCLRDLELHWNRVDMQQAEAVIADALKQAAAAGEGTCTGSQANAAAPAGPAASPAASPAAGAEGDGGVDADTSFDISTGPLQIHFLRASAAGPLVLAQLPSNTLTTMEVATVVRYPCDETAASALARLTGLQDLTMLSANWQQLLPAMSALTALTRACLLLRDLPLCASELQHLPPQLRRLEFTVGWAANPSSSRPPLHMKHLTALQELRISGYFVMKALDELPPSLVSLQVPDCPSAQPLLPLTHLSTLNMYNSTTSGSQLVKIAEGLTQLKEVSLGYFGAEESPDVDVCAPGWPGLPLRALDFDSNSGEFKLGPAALDALGRLGSCLTQLALSGGVMVETTPTGLSTVLARLTQLQTLRLAGVELLTEAPLEVAPATAAANLTQQQQQQQPAGGTSGNGNAAAAAAAAGGSAAAAAGGSSGATAAAAAGSSGTQAAAAAPSSRRRTRSCGLHIIGPAVRVIAAVAALQQLRSLKLGGLVSLFVNPAAELQPLGGATQLTCLHLLDMGLTDDVISETVGKLTQLRELDISDNAAVSDRALAAVGVKLTGLRNLDVSSCALVSEGGIKALKQQLQGVDVVCFQSSEEEEEWW